MLSIGAEQRIGAERLDHGGGVGVQVEQRPRALHRGGQIAQVIEPVAGLDVIGLRAQLDDPAPVGQAQAAPVATIGGVLDRGRRAQREELEQTAGIERRAEGQAQGERAAVLRAAVAARARAQLARRRGEHLPDRRVELAHALKARREGHLDDRDTRRLEQDPRRLSALRTREREWPGADDGNELAVDMALAVAEAASEPADAIAVDDAVGNQAHGPPDEIGATVPIGRARGGVGTAALTGAKARSLRSRGGWEEANVLPFGCSRGTAGTTVDAGCAHTAEDPSVEAGILGLDGLPDALGINQHASTMAHVPVEIRRESDMAVQPRPIPATRACRAGEGRRAMMLR